MRGASFASANAKGSFKTLEGEVSLDKNLNLDADYNVANRSRSGTLNANGGGVDMNIDNSFNIGIGGKLGFVKAGASVNLGKIVQGTSKLIDAGLEYMDQSFNNWFE